MRILMILIAAGVLIPMPLLSKEYNVKSPDGRTVLSVETTGGVSVSVRYDNREIISGLTPELHLGEVTFPGPKPALTRAVTSAVNEVIVPVVPRRNSSVPDVYNSLTLRFRGGAAIDFRVYDDGVAYRFATSMKDSVKVKTRTVWLQSACRHEGAVSPREGVHVT